MRFAKLHALGNDFLVLDALENTGDASASRAQAARRLCARHTGIGADGVLFYHRTSDDAEADFSALPMMLANILRRYHCILLSCS